MSRARRLPVTLALQLACAVTLAVLAWLWLAWLWLAPGWPAAWRQWQAPAPQPPNLDDMMQGGLSVNPRAAQVYPQVLARPLFAPGRRPGPPPGKETAEQAPPPAQPIDQARVRGLLNSAPLTGAMIEYDGQVHFVRMGESLGGWQLSRIQGRTAWLERNGQRRVFELPFPGQEPDPAASKAVPIASPSASSAAQPAGMSNAPAGPVFGGGRARPPASERG